MILEIEVGYIQTADAAALLLVEGANVWIKWDDELLSIFGISNIQLSEVRNSSSEFGRTEKEIFGGEISINALIGDQQSALFGQKCFIPGDTKNTYGTGCFMLMNTGKYIVDSKKGLLSTIA